MKKHRIKIISLLLAAIGILAASALIFIQTPAAGRLLLNRSKNFLRERAGIELQCARFAISLLDRSATLEKVTVVSASAPDLPPLFEASSIYVKLRLIDTITGFLHIERLEIASPRIQYFVDKDGNTNIPKFPESSSDEPLQYFINQADLRNGRFSYQDHQSGTASLIQEWQLSLRGDQKTFDHRILFNALNPSLPFSLNGSRIPVALVEVDGRLQREDFIIDSARVLFPGSEVSINGSIRNFADPEFDVSAFPKLDLATFTFTQPVQGIVSGEITARGKLDGLLLTAQLSGRDIYAGEFKQAGFDLTAHADWLSDRVMIRALELDSTEGFLEASGQIFPDASLQKVNSVAAGIRNFNPERLWKALELPISLASLISGKITLNWQGAFEVSKVYGDALLNLSATRKNPAPDILPLSGTIDVTMRSNQLRGSLRKAALMGATIDGTFAIRSFERLSAELQGTVPEIDALMNQLSYFTGQPGEPPAGVAITGAARFQAHADGRLTEPRITVEAEAPELQAAGLKHVGLESSAVIQGTHIAFHNTIALPQEARIEVNGTLETGGKKTVLTLDASTRGTPVSAVLATLEVQLPLSGEVAADVHFSGPVDDLAGNASVRGLNLILDQEPVGELALDAQLAAGWIRSDRFTMIRNPDDPETDCVNAHFNYSLETGAFEFDAKGKDLAIGRHSSGRSPIEGIINITASGSGTIEEPGLDLTLKSDGIVVQQKSLGPVSIIARLRSQDLTVDTTAPQLSLTSTANIINQTPFPFFLKAQVDNPDLSLIGITIGENRQLAGTIETDIEASGDFKNLVRSEASALIKKLRLSSGDLELHTAGPVKAEFRDQAIEITEPATLVSGNSRLQISGRVPLEESQSSGSLTLKGDVDLAHAAGFLPQNKEITPEGTLKLELALLGTPKRLSSSGTIALNNGLVRIAGLPEPVTNIGISAKIEEGALVLENASAVLGEATFSARGDFPFGLLPKDLPVQISRKTGPAHFNLSVDNLKPETTGLLPEGISGLIGIRAEGKASTLDLPGLEATVTFPDLRIKANQIELRQSEPSEIALKDGVASISRFLLTGAESTIRAAGSAGLLPEGEIELGLVGDFDAGLLSLIDDETFKATGKAQVRVMVGGVRKAPQFAGFVEMNEGQIILRNPRLVTDSLTVRLSLTPEKVEILEFKGTLNGGSLAVEGGVGYKQKALEEVNVKATLQDVFLDFPEGLKSSSGGTLTLTSQDDFIIAGGTIRVEESSYRDDFTVTGQLMNFLKSQDFVEEAEPNPLLDRIRFNVTVRTVTPLVVNNNIASLEATGNLRLVGTVNEPSVTGRITLAEGGEIVLNERTYFVNHGTITLTDQKQIRPELDIQAQTKAGDHLIILELSGTPDKLATNLRDEGQVLTERQIISLLLTGKTDMGEGEDNGAMGTMRSQALTLLAGQAGEQLTGEARQALRLSTLRIDPGQLDSDGPRLTLGEDITSKFSVLYSTSLERAAQTVAARYDISQRFNVQATRQDDNTFRFQMLHDLRLGGTARRRSARPRFSKFEIGSIALEGVSGPPAQAVLQKLSTKPGDKYDFPRIQKRLDKLQEFYTGQKRLEADIRLNRETKEDKVDLKLNIKPGPVVEFVYEGMQLPNSLKSRVEQAWADGVFDIERLDDAVLIIRKDLLERGYLQSDISYKVENSEDKKTIYFDIEPGVRYPDVQLTFQGTSRISDLVLKEALAQAGLGLEVHTNPRKVTDFLKRLYQQRGYLQASIGLPKAVLDPEKGTGRIIIAIQEGPQFLVGDLEFSGNSSFEYDQLWSVIPTSTGSIFQPVSMQDAVKSLEEFYHSRGYNDATIIYRTFQKAEAAQANVTFQIMERRRSIVREIVIEGNQRTSQDFVAAQLDFQVGDVLDVTRINETRRRLYSTRVYSSADFVMEDMPDTNGSRDKNIRVRVRLREVRPYRVQYGFLFDTERMAGGLLEAQNLNFMGKASTVGMRFRYDFDLKEARLYFNQPFVNKIHLKMDATAFYQQETREKFSAERKGFSLFRQKQLPEKFVLDYGYRYDHVTWEDRGFTPDPTIFQAEDPVSRLIVTINRDTRDSVLDATRGEFTSHSFEFGPKWLGSHTGFARYYGQYFKYMPLEKYFGMRTKDSEGKPVPSSLVYAAGLRIGLTSAFGAAKPGESPIISPERFFAGGGTTMRGFPQDLLGPTQTVTIENDDVTLREVEQPKGGEALFLFNNEIRFPLFGVLQGVVFLDIGNVYPRLSDFNFALRKSAGAGLRAKIKFIPLRFDYGWKIDRIRPTDRSSGEFFFSIGQAF